MSAETGTRPTVRGNPGPRIRSSFDYDPTPKAWLAEAKCSGRAAPTHDVAEARAIAIKTMCSKCPVRRECAQAALDAGEQYHVWGGVDLTQLDKATRRTILRRVVRTGEAEA